MRLERRHAEWQGATVSGKSRPIVKNEKTASRPLKVYRERANAAIASSETANVVAMIAISALFIRKCQNARDVMMMR